MIKLGPAGIGSVKDVETTFEKYHELGLKAAEIPFTYGVFIKKEEDMEKIKKLSEKFDIKLSIHAQYWINLNSKEKDKIEKSKQRILDCCRVGNKVGAYRIVFHPGYYGGMDKEETYQNIKQAILDIQKEIKSKGWKVKIAPETTGKVNVFGSLEEIARLVKETDCEFCIDFAHVLAREKKVEYSKIKKLFGQHKKWHCHFSGIEYGEKGEKRHIKTEKSEWKKLLDNLPKDKEIIVINEANDPVQDSVEGLEVLEN